MSVLSSLAALELPRGIAALMEIKSVYSRCRVRAVELEFDLHLSARQCLATERAGLFASRSAGDAVITSRGQFSSANCFSGLFAQRLIGHCPSSPEGANSIAFDDRMPSELSEIPERMTDDARRVGGKVRAEGLPVLVAIGAGAEAAGDLDLAQESGDSSGCRTIHLAGSRGSNRREPTRRPGTCEQIVHHAVS